MRRCWHDYSTVLRLAPRVLHPGGRCGWVADLGKPFGELTQGVSDTWQVARITVVVGVNLLPLLFQSGELYSGQVFMAVEDRRRPIKPGKETHYCGSHVGNVFKGFRLQPQRYRIEQEHDLRPNIMPSD